MKHYKYAIVRPPASTASQGLTTANLGVVDYALLKAQHAGYVKALTDLSVEVISLEPLEQFPDAYFTEDVAIVVPELAVITRPGALSRRGEIAHIRIALQQYRQIAEITEPGTLDGGDVLIVGKHCIVGISERTNESGANQLCQILSQFGYQGSIVEVPDALHFKSNVNFLDQNTLLVTQSCCMLDCLAGYGKLVVPEGEEYAANVVWINDHILIPAGYAGTRLLLSENGYQVIEMPVSEVAKMDGGLTCLSLRLS